MKKSISRRILSVLFGTVTALSSNQSRRPFTSDMVVKSRSVQISRQNFFQNAFLSLLSSPILLSSQPSIAKEDENKLTDVYFGTGCFWHIQHEFVLSERQRLNRPFNQITSKAGFAGGNATDKEGRVCYHNLQGVADYGKLGHGEVVGMKIPEASIVDFASDYFNMFSPNGERVDPMDRGAEYRALIGLPQGMLHPSFTKIDAIAKNRGFKLVNGVGNDPDTYGTKSIYVYDTTKFPFYQAEVYHQYHNDFQSSPYGKEYNGLAEKAFIEGRLQVTGCPDRV
jgi:peptide methionine sulfoxide reductase MsrA